MAAMQSDVSSEPINDAIPLENAIIRVENTKPIVKNTVMAILKIFFDSLDLPLALLFDTIMERATGSRAVDITYKYAYIS